MQFQQLKKELDEGKKRNFYLFTGEERAVLHKYIKRIGGKSIVESKSFTDLLPQLQSKGLFGKVSTYVVYNDKDVLEVDCGKVLKACGKNTVILVYDSIDNRKKFFKQMKDHMVHFERFTDDQLVSFILSQFEMSENEAYLFVQYCGKDVARIENEVHKFKHLGQEVTTELIKEMIAPPVEDKIFEMLDAIVLRKRLIAYRLLADLYELKESPIKIISVLYMKFRQLYIIQSMCGRNDYEIAEKTDLNPYVVKMNRPLVGKFSNEEILEALRMTQTLEVEVKTGKVEMFAGLDNLFSTLLKN